MNRLIFIDIAKGIAIVLVVIGHYFPDNHPHWYGEMREIIYGFHMPLFMFASGLIYIATVKEESYHSFIWRKVKRLLVPYLVVSVLVISIKLLTQGFSYVENPVTIMSYVKIFYLPEAGYFTWFIWTLWWMFVIIPFFETKSKRLFLLFIAVLLYFLPFQLPEVFCLKEFKGMLIYFCLGCVVWDFKGLFSRLTKIPTYVYAVCFIGVNCIKYLNISACWGGQLLLVSIVGISFVISYSRWIETNFRGIFGRLLLILASSSYIIYLLHTTFEGFAKSAIFKIPILTDAQNDVMFSLGAIIVISYGIIMPVILDIYILRRYKFTKLLFGYK